MNTSQVTSRGNVLDGPNKEEVMKGLTDNPCDPQASGRPFRRVTEFIANNEAGVVGKLRVSILSISVEDGSGTILNIEGNLHDGMSRDKLVWICYDTKSRKGPYTIHNPEVYRQGKLYGLSQNIKVGDSFKLRYHDNSIPLRTLITKLETRGTRVLAQALAENDLGEDSEWFPINLLFDPGADHAELLSFGPSAREFTLSCNTLPQAAGSWTIQLNKGDRTVEVDVHVSTVSANSGEYQRITGSIKGSMDFEAEVQNALSPNPHYGGWIKLSSCFD